MVAKKSDESTPTNLPVERSVSEATTWDEVMQLAPEIYSSNEVFGDGAVLIQNKDLLIDAGEFIILDWRVVTDKTTLRDYVTILAINRNNVKARFNDGSTGIMRQLLDYQDRMGGRVVPVHCQNVRKSEYIAELPDGTKSNATTYYLV